MRRPPPVHWYPAHLSRQSVLYEDGPSSQDITSGGSRIDGHSKKVGSRAEKLRTTGGGPLAQLRIMACGDFPPCPFLWKSPLPFEASIG